MKKHYNCPAVEVMNVYSASAVCAVSTTENFSIVNPSADPGSPIVAEEGR